tara:strand:- start:41 stop:751 length:711 start_codon:yes stop_codon:yes gene_type:complete
MVFNYQVLEANYGSKEITFIFNSNTKLRHTQKIEGDFEEYVLTNPDVLKKYFVDLNSGELVIIENENEIMKSMRGPTKGFINHNGCYYRPAIHSDIDFNEEKYNSDNWKLYNHLKEIYTNKCTPEVYKSKDNKIEVHIGEVIGTDNLYLYRYDLEKSDSEPERKIILEKANNELRHYDGTRHEKIKSYIQISYNSLIFFETLKPFLEGVFKSKNHRYNNYDSHSDDYNSDSDDYNN